METLSVAANLSADEVSAELVRSIRDWCVAAPQHDDLTFVVLKVKSLRLLRAGSWVSIQPATPQILRFNKREGASRLPPKAAFAKRKLKGDFTRKLDVAASEEGGRHKRRLSDVGFAARNEQVCVIKDIKSFKTQLQRVPLG